jgi:hypothetical protein
MGHVRSGEGNKNEEKPRAFASASSPSGSCSPLVRAPRKKRQKKTITKGERFKL